MSPTRTRAQSQWLRDFGRRLFEVRSELGVSQLALAAASSLSQPYLSDIENGRRNPSLITIKTLAEALEIDAQDLLAPPAGHA